MSIIRRKGQALLAHLARQRYFDQRRAEVDKAWGKYRLEVIEREERGEETPFRHGFDELSKQTDSFVKREAQKWAKSCRKYRLYEDDFESIFRFTVAKAALRYEGDGSFFDYLRGAIRNAGRDLVRRALTKKNRITHLALSLDDEQVKREVERRANTARSAEDEAISRIVIEQMAADRTLTEQDRRLFNFLHTAPDATLQEIADELGLRDRKQASRVKERLANKLRKFYE